MQRNDSTCTMKLLLLSLKKNSKIKSTICVSALYLFSKENDNKTKSYRCTAKSHATLFPKKFISLI